MSTRGRAKRGIILIVEGTSDQTALEGYLECLFPECTVKTYVVRGDVTNGVGKDGKKIKDYNPLKEIEIIALKVMSENGWKPQDVKEVIHVTDTDGAYIDESYVKEDLTICTKMVCTPDALLSQKPIDTITRNRHKRSYTIELLSHRTLLQKYKWNIPYSLYYMSTNLEHVTQGDNRAYTLQEKNDLAQEFRNHCFADEGEIRKIFHDSSLEGKSHEESWDFILASKHSLERHTNLGLLESS